MFFFLFLQLDVWASLYRMMFAQRLTPKSCFHIHLLKVESFSVLSTIYKCDVETWSLQHTYTENELYSEDGDILYPAVKLLIWTIFIYSKIIDCSVERDSVGVILSIFHKVVYGLCGKFLVRHDLLFQAEYFYMP